MTTRLASLATLLALLATLPARAADSPADCAPTRASNWAAATGVPDTAQGDVRVYAIQYKQEIRYASSYDAFDLKMDCLVRELVLPTADENHDGKADRPTIVSFTEDAGLATIATGTRGAAARASAEYGPKDPTNIPGALAAFGAVGAAYHRPIAYYAARFPDTSAQRLILAAATDTFVRGFMRTNSDLARRYGIYVVSSNNQPEFRETADPVAVAALADPDLAPEYASGSLTTVYEAVDVPGTTGSARGGIDVYNTAYLWAPDDGVTGYATARFEQHNGAPLSANDPRANIIAVNTKTPLTPIEQQILDLTDSADLSSANTGPFHLLASDDQRIAIGFGISLPAFKWGTDFGVAVTGDPCASSSIWMRCLDHRGVTLFLQPEANPGMWAEYHDAATWDPPAFQSLSWLDSAWRAVADPTVHNIRYAVTPMMTGNLVDLTFDGQSSIFERCLPRPGGDTCDGNVAGTHVGAGEFIDCNGATERCDDPKLLGYSGAKRETIVMAPWVLDDCPLCTGPLSNRERLAARSRAMQAGTRAPEENGYLETAVWADLDFD